MKKKLLLVIILISTALNLNAQEFVKGGFFKTPDKLTNVNGVCFFSMFDMSKRSELWKSDGTPNGTVKVSDILAGTSGTSFNSSIFASSKTLFFSTWTSTYGNELWVSDGTNAGTTLLKDINPGTNNSNPGENSFNTAYNEFASLNGVVFFSADDGINGRELWKSDGTSSGTVMVKDIMSGGTSSPSFLCNVNGKIFFSAYSSTSGQELWKTDGTTQGTVMVKDINPGLSSSSPICLTNVNNTLFFYANDGVHGNELWKSDGTSAGTVLVKDINFGSGESNPNTYGPVYLINLKNTLYFFANDGVSGFELWKSNGTTAGTSLVKDICVGIKSSIANPYNFNPLLAGTDGGLSKYFYFRATDGINGAELWKSDGTADSTIMVKDMYPGIKDSNPRNLTCINDICYFVSTWDGSLSNELYKTDGTSSGTIHLIVSNNSSNSGVESLINIDGNLFFTSTAMGKDGLWKYNPSLPNFIDKINADASVDIYPNPFTNRAYIQFSEEQNNTEITLIDIMGKQVKSFNCFGRRVSIDKGDMKPGIYVIQITSKNKRIINKRIIVQ